MRRQSGDDDVRACDERVLEVARDGDARGIVHVERIGDVAELQRDLPGHGPHRARALQEHDAPAVELMVGQQHEVRIRGRLQRIRIVGNRERHLTLRQQHALGDPLAGLRNIDDGNLPVDATALGGEIGSLAGRRDQQLLAIGAEREAVQSGRCGDFGRREQPMIGG